MTFVCPRCSTSSEHPADLAAGYCARCHDFTAKPVSPEVVAAVSDPLYCAECRHTHTTRAWGGICVGCPCPWLPAPFWTATRQEN